MRFSTPEQPPERSTECWSISQLASVLGVSYWTVRRLVRSGQIRAIRISRLWRIPEEEVQRLLREGTKR